MEREKVTVVRLHRRLIILELVITSLWFVFVLAGMLVLPMQADVLDASSNFLLPSNTWHYSPAVEVVRAPEYDACVNKLIIAWLYLLAGFIVLAASLLDMLAVVQILNQSAAPISVPIMPFQD